MAAKKSKKSKQELIKAVIEGLSTDDPTGLGGPLIPDGDGTKSSVDRALVNPAGGNLFHDERTLPLGISSKTSVFQIGKTSGFQTADSERSEVSAAEPKTDAIEGLFVGEKKKHNVVFEQVSSDDVTRVLSSQASRTVSSDEKTSVLSPVAPTTLIEEHRDVTYVSPARDYSTNAESSEKTVVVAIESGRSEPVEEKISFGVARPSTRSPGSQGAMMGDAQIGQAETLRIAQERMVELEKELEKLRAENETLSSANSSAKEQLDESLQKVAKLEREVSNSRSLFESELEIHRDGASAKDAEITKLRRRTDDLEGRLHQDLRKIRVRERELENRLELTKMEKDSLLRSKDEAMLELKRKIDNLNFELQGYRQRVTDLNQKIESNTDQFARTVRALRLALTNLEVSDSAGGSMTITPLKKAE